MYCYNIKLMNYFYRYGSYWIWCQPNLLYLKELQLLLTGEQKWNQLLFILQTNDDLQICFLNSYDKYYFWMKHIFVNFKWSQDDNTDTLWKEDKISAFYFSLEDSIFFSEQDIARFDKRLQKKCIFTLIY